MVHACVSVTIKHKTPYARMLSSVSIAEEFKNRVRAVFPTLDPVILLQEIERLQSKNFKRLLVHPSPTTWTRILPEPKEEGKASRLPSLEEKSTIPTPGSRAAKSPRKSKTISQQQITSITIIEMPPDYSEAHKKVTAAESQLSDFAALTERFFNKHLKKHSPNTVTSYRDTFRLLEQYPWDKA